MSLSLIGADYVIMDVYSVKFNSSERPCRILRREWRRRTTATYNSFTLRQNR